MKAVIDECNGLEEAMQRSTLALSWRLRFVHVPQSGHNVHIVAAEVVAGAVGWVSNGGAESDILGRQ